jgi:misacylated tRNA(Ala) deacylase
MTELLFQLDSYLRMVEARVVAVQERTAALDRTVFYPNGGGQPNDEGTLRAGDQTWQVTNAEKSGGTVWHTVDGQLPPVGTRVTGEIDWARRYALMRTHTALHILCGVVWRDYGAQVTGGNMDPLEGRMDFEFENLHKDLVGEIETRVNAEVAAARPVVVRILPRDEAFQIPDLIRTKINLLPPGIPVVRTVELVGLDLQADGGTHVANTREVGRIHVPEYKSKGKINKRIYVRLE